MLLGTVGGSLLRNILVGWGTNRAGEGVMGTVYGNKSQDHKNKWIFNATSSCN